VTCPVQGLLLFRFGGDVNAFQPSAISEPGATRENACLPKFTAGEDGNWMLPADGLVNVTAAGSSINMLEKCAAACLQGGLAAGCQFVSFDYISNMCFLRQAAAGSAR
jgi:hypothetical protein